jgi:hypothetical protein
MQQRKIIRTTLGELIVAVTDEVVPFVRNRASLYTVVSCVVSDLLGHHHPGMRERSRRQHSTQLCVNGGGHNRRYGVVVKP